MEWTITSFRTRVDEGSTAPTELDPCMRALWYGRCGAWEASHDLVNEIDTELGSWIHAWLHRVEGDISNAAYWYKRAGEGVRTGELEAEWEELVAAAIAQLPT
jgi:hypothetical protein